MDLAGFASSETGIKPTVSDLSDLRVNPRWAWETGEDEESDLGLDSRIHHCLTFGGFSSGVGVLPVVCNALKWVSLLLPTAFYRGSLPT
jgi:hypothetical protein